MPTYEPPTTREVWATRGPRKGVVAFRDAVLFWTRPRGASDLGIYVRRNVRGGSTASLHAVGRAWDIGGVKASTPGNFAHELVPRLVAAAPWCGITEVIYNRRRWTDGGWRPYAGTDAHTTHVHVGFTRAWADAPASHDQLVRWTSKAVFGL